MTKKYNYMCIPFEFGWERFVLYRVLLLYPGTLFLYSSFYVRLNFLAAVLTPASLLSLFRSLHSSMKYAPFNQIVYIAPCGYQVRSILLLTKYLIRMNSKLMIDMFTFDLDINPTNRLKLVCQT